MQNNIIHASDAVDTAVREIGLYFQDSELFSYSQPDDQWLK
jgi:nucleoside-diphosphate kinase